MKSLTEIQHLLKQLKPMLIEQYGICEIGLFGSYVRGEQHGNSDLDILVELEKPVRIDLIGFIEMENYLSDALGVKADLVIKEDLKPLVGQQILNEVIAV
jgi:hypothetical protein